MTENNDIKMVIITGMCGAGKTVALQSFEDLGYFVWIIYHRCYCQSLLSLWRIQKENE